MPTAPYKSHFACLWCGHRFAGSREVYAHIADRHPDRMPSPDPNRPRRATGRKQQILEFIERYRTQHEYPPTVREIGGAVGLASPATVHSHLVDLIEMGALERVPRRARTRWAAEIATELAPTGT
jgi:hypothetical protein